MVNIRRCLLFFSRNPILSGMKEFSFIYGTMMLNALGCMCPPAPKPLAPEPCGPDEAARSCDCESGAGKTEGAQPGASSAANATQAQASQTQVDVAQCKMESPVLFETPMSDVDVQRWLGKRGLVNANLAQTCYGELSWPRHHKDALLCSHLTIVNGAYAKEGGEWAEIWAEVVTVEQGRLKPLMSLPVGIAPLAGPICSMSDAIAESMGLSFVERSFDSSEFASESIQLETLIGPDKQTVILRSAKRPYCGEGLPGVEGMDKASLETVNAFWKRICEGEGVYTFKGDSLVRKEDGIVLSGPSSHLKLSGGTLKGPCVEPKSVSTEEAPIRDLQQSDLDLDGDGVFDLVYFAGAARWQSTYDLYVRRGGCGYFVGYIVSSEWPRRLPTKSHGLYDLLTADDECPTHFTKSKAAPGDGKAASVSHDNSLYDDASADGLTLGEGYCDIIWRFNGSRYEREVSAPTERRPDGIRP
jgi:hypothetical protein